MLNNLPKVISQLGEPQVGQAVIQRWGLTRTCQSREPLQRGGSLPETHQGSAHLDWGRGVDRKGRCGGDADVCTVYRSLYWGGVRVHGSPGGANREF